MTDRTSLTVAFLDRVPRAAAQELQRLPIKEAAALAESVPTRLYAPVLSAMIPWHAARLLENVTPSKAGALLRLLGFVDSISIMRLVGPDGREPVFEALPSRYSRRLRAALTYAPHQVGAWTDPDIPTLSVADTVGDALRVLRDGRTVSHVFLESEGHEKFVGVVSVAAILRGEQSAKLAALPIVHATPIFNRASLASLTFDDRWDDFLHLPVVGRRGNLLGGLSRRTLRNAVHAQFLAGTESRRSLLRNVMDALSVTCAGLLKLVLSREPAVGTAVANGSNDEY